MPLKKVILAENTFDPNTWEEFEVSDVCRFLVDRFDRFPDSARIYHNQVGEDRDVTPSDEAGIAKLNSLEGTFYVVVYPGAAAIPYIIYAVIAIAAYYYAKSQIPSVAMQRNVQQESPNNELSERSNRARPRARIPDIYGTVRSTPDLLTLPYSIYENHIEVEYSYMCVGRGAYDIQSAEVKDETTPITEIQGSGVDIYAPDTSPNSGDSPQLTVGETVEEPLVAADRSNAVNGQVLKAGNLTFIGEDDVKFYVETSGAYIDDGVCELITGSTRNFTEYFNVGDQVMVTGSAFDYAPGAGGWSPGVDYVVGDLVRNGNNSYLCNTNHTSDSSFGLDAAFWDQVSGNVDGTYTVSSIEETKLYLDNPKSVNAGWGYTENIPTAETEYLSPQIEREESPQWVGPFLVQSEDLKHVYNNFIAVNGLYVDTGSGQTKIDVTVEIEITPTDAAGVAVGAVETYQGTIAGSSVLRSSRAVTLKTTFGTATTGFEGYYKIRARRVTPVITTPGSVVDEIKWRDLYSMADVPQNDFGNVTTVHSVTRATGGALVAKSRKLNMLVTRKIPRRVSGSTFTSELYATDRADEIISAICLDPYIGNRSTDEVDFDNIYDTVAEIETYFGIEKAVEFGYTFDADNLSFEEMVSSVAGAIFCTAYRFGSVIKLNFEKETEDSVLLFNHRNKLPGSEKRSVRFGNQSDFDSIEVEYVDSTDDSVATIYLPDDTGQNPKKIETIGVRNRVQAYWAAQRFWGKIQYQNIASEFDATQEADLLALNDRILVADNTRSGTQDGEVVSQNGLELTLSQPVTFTAGETYTIFLQHVDGTTESLSVTAGSDEYKVVLGAAPKAALSLDASNFARATYQIVSDNDTREQAFLVTEKETLNNFTSRVTAINYDSRYYTADEYYKDGTINEEGEINLAGTVSFTPEAGALVFLSRDFPVAITVNQSNPSATIRYSKTAMPSSITDGDLYTGPVDVNDGETLYARAFTSLNSGVGINQTYNSSPNLDFEYNTNSQYLGAF